MREFDSPEISNRDLGEIGFDYAFQLTLEYDGPYVTETPRGGRVYKGVIGGEIKGRLNGTVYPQGGGEYSLRREDGVEDLNAHILLKADNGEWLHLSNLGYDRPDGYYRTATWVDADVRGEHTWVQGAIFIGVGEEAEDGSSITITYYESV